MLVQHKPGGQKKDYLTIVDRSSGYTWIKKLSSTKTKAMIQVIDEYVQMFSGPPFTILADNGPQYRESN